MSALPAFFGNGPDYDDGQPESERIAELIGLPHYHWLPDAIADAIDSGDAIYLLSQCIKHLTPKLIQQAAQDEAERLAEPEPQE